MVSPQKQGAHIEDRDTLVDSILLPFDGPVVPRQAVDRERRRSAPSISSSDLRLVRRLVSRLNAVEALGEYLVHALSRHDGSVGTVTLHDEVRRAPDVGVADHHTRYPAFPGYRLSAPTLRPPSHNSKPANCGRPLTTTRATDNASSSVEAENRCTAPIAAFAPSKHKQYTVMPMGPA